MSSFCIRTTKETKTSKKYSKFKATSTKKTASKSFGKCNNEITGNIINNSKTYCNNNKDSDDNNKYAAKNNKRFNKIVGNVNNEKQQFNNKTKKLLHSSLEGIAATVEAVASDVIGLKKENETENVILNKLSVSKRSVNISKSLANNNFTGKYIFIIF